MRAPRSRAVCRRNLTTDAGGSPQCFEPAVRVGFCRRHYFEAWQAWKRQNVAHGRCWCGAERLPGRMKCHRHLATHRDWRRRTSTARKAADGSREYWALARFERQQLRRYGLAEGKQFARIEAEATERALPAAESRLIRDRVPVPTDRQRVFVARYLEHGNGARAAREAGYAPLSAARGGSGARVRAHRGLCIVRLPCVLCWLPSTGNGQGNANRRNATGKPNGCNVRRRTQRGSEGRKGSGSRCSSGRSLMSCGQARGRPSD